MVLDAIFDFIKEKVIIAGVTWIIGLLNPASAFFKACKAIYDIVMFFVNRGSQILALVNAVIDSIAAIVKGNLKVAADFVEAALAKAVPVAIGFLAGLLGLGDPSKPVKQTIEKAQSPVNKAIDWVIHQAVKLVKAAGKFIKGLFGKKDKDEGKKPAAPSEQVREVAMARLEQMVGAEAPVKKVQGATAKIAQDLRKDGLKRFEVRKAKGDASYEIVTEASPLTVAATMAPVDANVVVAMTVSIKLAGEEPPLAGSIAERGSFAPTRPPDDESAKGFVQGRKFMELTPPSVHGLPAKDERATRTSGLAVLEPRKGDTSVDMVAWNTSAAIKFSNVSHAEHQFN